MMKKWIAIMLVLACTLCLLAGCGAKEEEKTAVTDPPDTASSETQPEDKADSSGYDNKLDAIFETGQAELVAAEISLPDFETCEIVMPPDSFWDMFVNPHTEAEIRELLKSGFRVATLSPDGKTAVGYVKVTETKTVTNGKRTYEKEVENYIQMIVSGGKVTVLYPTDQRGRGELADLIRENYMGMTAPYWGKPVQLADALDYSGFIWSPDGRYFCPFNAYAAQNKMQTAGQQASAIGQTNPDSIATPEADPYHPLAAYTMVDLQTGEIFALDAMVKDYYQGFWYEIWLNGFFSEDGQFFNAFAKGQKDTGSSEMEWRIDRYDMNTLEKTVYMSNLSVSTWPVPGMTLLKDGRVFGVTRFMDSHERFDSALARFTAENQTEAVEISNLSAERLSPQTEYTAGSSKSGQGLLLVSYFRGRSQGEVPSGLIRVQMDGDIGAEKDTLWVWPAQTKQMEPMAVAQVAETNSEWIKAHEKEHGFSGNYLAIYQVKMSPDGRYAIALAVNPADGGVSALLIRLSDMKSIPVESPALCTGSDLSLIITCGTHLMDWTEAGILITTEEASTLYQFR